MTLCATTGLELVDGPGPGSYRIARSSYGPLAPKVSDESVIDEDDADLTIVQEFCKIQTR